MKEDSDSILKRIRRRNRLIYRTRECYLEDKGNQKIWENSKNFWKRKYKCFEQFIEENYIKPSLIKLDQWNRRDMELLRRRLAH